MADNSITHLVVVGSSAGGIGALSGLVSSLPQDFDAPIVVAQHLDPNRESHLQEILARKSPLPVKTVAEHEPLQAGVVFVIPANRHVNITDSEIDLSSEPASGQPKPSINLLMESAAEVFGENLIAIVLSGTGTDGTEGARTVSQAGGTVIIQDPETAEFGEMPRSLAPSTVDIVSSLEEIGPVLKNLISGIVVPEESSEDEGRDLGHFLEELHRNRGVDFRSYKRPTILRRLGRRMAVTECESLDEYSRYLEEHPEEYRQLIGTFLIKVTEFFRDPDLFDHLREEVLPGLIEEARQKENQLRIWSAGCATGEEAYSLAILVSQVLGREAGFFDVRIFATDIDEDAIRFARRGVYPPSALQGLSAEQIGRYFVEEDGSYQVKKQIRGMIVFGEHDLAQRSPFPNIDMLVSRNVLIYFSAELQRRALQLFAYSLRDGGYLVVGKAESPSPLADFFAPVDRQNKIYRRQGQRFLLPPTLPKGQAPRVRLERSFGDRGVNQGQAETQQQLSAASRTAGEDLLNRLPVGIVVVARDYAIEAMNTAARQMLSIPGVGVGQDFLHAMQEAPYVEVRRTIDGAFKEGRTTQTEQFAVEEAATGEPGYLRLTCHPRRVELEGQGVESVLVVVEDATAEVRMRRLSEKNLRLEEANRELGQLNEELQSAHQESLVNTEEAQASAEEVETLNEELQATNEELETLNEELHATVEELNTTNDDLQSRATELQELAQSREEEQLRCVEVWHRPNAVPDDFVDACLQTRYVRGEGLAGRSWLENRPVWTGDAPQEERFGEEADWSDGLRSALAFPILGGGGPRGIIELLGSEVLHPDRELLYTVGLIGGQLGQFADRRRAEKELREAEERLRLATEAGRVGLLDWDVLADECRCSGAMAEIYGYPPGEFNSSYEGFLKRVHPGDRGRVRRMLDAAVAAGAPHELEFRIVRPTGDVRWVQSKGRVHRDKKGVPARVLGVTLDVTEQKQAEQERDRLHSLEVGARAEDAERVRISRELHDRVAHSMGVAHQSLQLYEALAEKDPVRAHGKLQTAKEMTKTALEQTRNLSMELRRPETENGLVAALQDLLEVAVPDDISAELSTSGKESRLSDHQRGQLYLLLREAVRNAVRHSGCRSLTVGLDVTPENVSGYVEDDGRGFEGNGGTQDGLGLRSMRERVALLQGTVEVYSSQKGGAGVQVRLPLRNGGG